MDSPPRSLSDRLYRREGIVALVKYHLRTRTYSHRIRSPRPPPPLVSDNFWLVRSEQPTPKEKPAAAAAGQKGSGERMGRRLRLRAPQWVGYGGGGIESEFVACN